MNSLNTSWTLTSDPVWPWSLPAFGAQALLAVALLLAVLTVWSYLGVRGASLPRVSLILVFRLVALVLAFLVLLRPSFALRDELRVPSLLVLAVDDSESTTIRDEFDNQSRWEYELATLRKCQPLLDRLRDEYNVNVLVYRFGSDVKDFDPAPPPDGKRTDFGLMLQTLFEKHRSERYLRGLVVLSDGADNGTRYPPLPLAGQWRSLPCPVHAVAFGKPTTSDRQSDIAVTDIAAEPAPVPVKQELTVKGTVNAPGFENAKVRVQVLFDDAEVAAEDATLEKTVGNEVKVKCTAPSQPGEIKVTFRVRPLPGEMSTANNEITTYLTVTKEGLSVLVVDKERAGEPQALIDALRADPRIRVYVLWSRGTQPFDPDQKDLFEFDKQHYDVIILGDVTADRLRAGSPQALATIHRLVNEKSTGLMMMGGRHSFGGTWRGTEIERLLPVKLEAGGEMSEQVDRPLKMVPTKEGLAHYVMRLADTPEASDAVWKKLRPLDGGTKLGEVKPGAEVLARAGDPVNGPPLLVGQNYGAGRTLAFAGDTTFHWRNPEGLEPHARFWKQVVLWLAKQEETEGAVWVKPEKRRLAAGSKVDFTAGMRGKGGVELTDFTLEAKVVSPQGAETLVPTARDKAAQRGVFWKTDAAGEYRVVVAGKGKDVDGQEVSGEASARFVVYQDEAEMARRAADHEFLRKLAAAGGGQFLRPEELPKFLEDLKAQPLLQGKPKVATWPDWKSAKTSAFQPIFLVLFVGLLALEWFLRRRWGLV
jgi:uncharacterized membrane protein